MLRRVGRGISLRARPLPAPQQTDLQLTACEFSAERNRKLLPSCGPASHTASGLLNLPTALTTRFRQAGSASNLPERCRSEKTCLMRNLGPCHSGSSAALYPFAKIRQAKSSIKFIRMSVSFGCLYYSESLAFAGRDLFFPITSFPAAFLPAIFGKTRAFWVVFFKGSFEGRSLQRFLDNSLFSAPPWMRFDESVFCFIFASGNFTPGVTGATALVSVVCRFSNPLAA